jgi:hypothetical protein
MASQPANTTIKVFRTLRSYRRADRQEAIASLTKRLRPQVMSVPGREDLVEVEARDTAVSDFSSYMGEARTSASRGYPVVIGLRDQVSLANAQGNLTEIGFAFKIGQDQFLENTEAGLTRDLHTDARALAADVPA